jgi:uncharacterized protein
MTYTELKKRNNKTYFYRAKSIRNGEQVKKLRTYMGTNLTDKELQQKIRLADKILTYNSQTEHIIETIREILIQNGIQKASIFGSFAKGTQTKKSDIDILIEPPKHMGFAYFGLFDEIEKKINRKVDIITYDSISPHIKEEVIKNSKKII